MQLQDILAALFEVLDDAVKLQTNKNAEVMDVRWGDSEDDRLSPVHPHSFFSPFNF